MTLFNPQTQYTIDVSGINQQIRSDAAQSAAYYGTILAAESAYRSATAKTLDQIAPLLGQVGKLQHDRKIRREAELEGEFFEQDAQLSAKELKVKYNDEVFDTGEHLRNSIEAQQITAGTDELNRPGGNVFLGGELLNGDPAIKNNYKRLLSRSERYGEYWAYASGPDGIKLQRADGTDFTLSQARTYSERIALKRVIRNIWVRESINDGSTATERRRHLHKEMRRIEQLSDTEWEQSNKAAIKEVKKRGLEQEMSQLVKADILPSSEDDIRPNQFVEQVRKNRGYHDPEGKYGIARAAQFDIAIDMAKTNQMSLEEINRIGNSWFTGNDGGRHQIKKLWKKDFNRLLKAGINARKESNESKKEEVTGAIEEWGLKLEEEWGQQETPITRDQVDAKIAEFRANPEWRGRGVPEVISKYYTKQDELDEQIQKRVMNRAANLLPVDITDLAGISNPALKLQLINQLKISSLSTLDSAQIKNRDTFITTEAATTLRETDALKTKSREYNNTVLRATAFFNQRYSELIAENPNNKAGAYSTARKETIDGIQAGNWKEYETTKINDTTSGNMKTMWETIAANPNAINEGVLPAVTEHDLAKGLKAIKGDGDYPAVFRSIASNQGLDPFNVTIAQVNAGLREEGAPEIKDAGKPKVTEDMEKALKPEETVLLNKKNTPVRTQRALTSADGLDWYIDNVKDSAAMNNGGYNAIRKPNGEWVKEGDLEKPLTQHTILEIFDLLEKGYGDLSAFGMTPTQFVNRVNRSGLTADDLFDEATQDTLALLPPPQNDYSGFYGANEIAGLSKEDRGKMSSIAGTIPSKWNEVQNLRPEFR